MALISYRISAEGTVAEARRRNAAASKGDAFADLEERVVVDVVEAALCGVGDCLDLGVGRGRIGILVAEATGAALASALMTLTGGDRPLAESLVDGALAEIAERTRRRIAMPSANIVVGEPVMRVGGRA